MVQQLYWLLQLSFLAALAVQLAAEGQLLHFAVQMSEALQHLP